MNDDKELRNEKIKLLHDWLLENITGYVALCEAGSTTAGDPWIEGRSDRDITIVVSEHTEEIEDSISFHLTEELFNDKYLFIIFSKEHFLTTHSDQDISIKFRGMTLFGEDLVSIKETPSKEFVSEIAEKGLKGMKKKFKTRLLNSGHWSENHLKDKLYPEFKHLFMYLADRQYATTGIYPRRRQDAAKAAIEFVKIYE